MKKFICAILAIIMLISLAACGKTVDIENYNPTMEARKWIKQQIKNNTLFSFTFDGKSFADHIRQWEKKVDESENAWTLTYKKDNMVVWSEITLDPEMAAVEWTNYFQNNGMSDSPVISEIRAADTTLHVENPILTAAEGSTPSRIDFQPITVNLTLPEKNAYSMKTNGGRSSQGAFPYFDICNGEYGIVGAIGWTGNWDAHFLNENGKIAFDAGMQETKISLHAGEQMRTPMIMIQFFKGNQDAGHNALRQLVLKSYTPKDTSGKPITHGMAFIGTTNVCGYGEDALITAAKSYSTLNYECLWIDAGWYGDEAGDTLSNGAWTHQVGNWYFIPSVYPNGNIQKLGEYLKETDKGLLLWFEPERAMPGTRLVEDHPEWFIKGSQDSGFRLLNLGIDEVCDYMIEWIGSTIQENHLTWYRQDFNCDPDERWRIADRNEGENRTGITEIKYITNEYRFLDGLIEMNPGLLIDNCASGGKRLDLEMMRRSVPMWNTDYTCSESKLESTPDGVRSINYNLTWWLPISACGWPHYNSEDVTYNFRCVMMSGIQLQPSIAEMSRVKTMTEEYYICRELMDGNYYMLDYGKDDGIETEDACYEFYKPDLGKGYLMAFRPEECKTESASYRLKGLDATATYKLTVTDSGDEIIMSGEKLMTEGLKINYPRSNFSILIYIDKV